jgi:hypothetical protein
MKSIPMLILPCVLTALGIFLWKFMVPISDPRERAEHEHGLILPRSAHAIQCKGDAWHGFLDRGAATLFEMDQADLNAFVSQLRVQARTAPTSTKGDPTINGWNIWPQSARTFVPGNQIYAGFQTTWTGTATPVEMLSCSSLTGDWLHVELWKLHDDAMIVKMFTDWN